MSLNCREIDLILEELSLPGMKVEKVSQPSYDTIVLSMHGGGRTLHLLLCVGHGACRLHAVTSLPAKNDRPLRFMECLRSRIRGSRIIAATQLGDERIVRIDLENSEARHTLYARLWSGAGNLVLVDGDGIIVDALARKPSRGELSGLRCTIGEAQPPSASEAAAPAKAAGAPKSAAAGSPAKPARVFTIRELPGSGSFNERIASFYAERGAGISREALLETARERHGRRMRMLREREGELAARAGEFRDADRLRELGDILIAGYPQPEKKGNAWYAIAQDFYRGGEVSIKVDPDRSHVENAQAYYERYRKASSGIADLELELERTRVSIRNLDAWLARAESETDPYAIARMLSRAGTAREKEVRRYPGLAFIRDGWVLLVGRNAAENDALLRRHVRGSDLWLHARDRAGSYVFVKAQRGKSVPLEVLIDAGMLAIYYSKARAEGEGDLYYTQAKHLRRAKDAPRGTVLPSHEKNLYVRIEEARLKGLLAMSDGAQAQEEFR